MMATQAIAAKVTKSHTTATTAETIILGCSVLSAKGRNVSSDDLVTLELRTGSI
jgi:hypothetical protein